MTGFLETRDGPGMLPYENPYRSPYTGVWECPGCGSVDTGRIPAGDTYCIECNADRVHDGAMVDCGESECRRIVERDAAILAEAIATGGTVIVDIPVDEIADRCRPCGDLVEWDTLHRVDPPVAMPYCKSGCTLAGSVDVIHF